jgi:hypothetical protein
MIRVAILALLLIAGLVGSQLLPWVLGSAYVAIHDVFSILTMVALGYIMIQVGREFDLDKSKVREYAWDYVVAATAAAFPWLFVAAYFVFMVLPDTTWPAWKEALLTARFAAPTSAGVLFGMLAAAGLAETWVFKKARLLAIFDDLDTVLLMVALQIVVLGIAWELVLVAVLAIGLLWLAWSRLRRIAWPSTWPWVLAYASAITAMSKALNHGSTLLGTTVPIQMEVLLPAFVLGCLLAPERDPARISLEAERHVAALVCGAFMLLVGLHMPVISGDGATSSEGAGRVFESITVAQPMPGWDVIAWHVLAVTVLSNLGKLFPAACYRKEASLRERIALAIGMWPRGEVGAGVLFVSLGSGIGGPMVTIALLSLLLNLVLTGLFIWLVKWLVIGNEAPPSAQSPHRTQRLGWQQHA